MAAYYEDEELAEAVKNSEHRTEIEHDDQILEDEYYDDNIIYIDPIQLGILIEALWDEIQEFISTKSPYYTGTFLTKVSRADFDKFLQKLKHMD